MYGDAVPGYQAPVGGAAPDAARRVCVGIAALANTAWGNTEQPHGDGDFDWDDFDPGLLDKVRPAFPALPPAGVALALRIWGAPARPGHAGDLRPPARPDTLARQALPCRTDPAGQIVGPQPLVGDDRGRPGSAAVAGVHVTPVAGARWYPAAAVLPPPTPPSSPTGRDQTGLPFVIAATSRSDDRERRPAVSEDAVAPSAPGAAQGRAIRTAQPLNLGRCDAGGAVSA
ncbi:hypothetical protein ACU686_27050 [Yinghuangia aomiensis]